MEHDGQWWAAARLPGGFCDDNRGWMADVTWTQQHDWGPGKYMTMVPPERLRVPSAP